MKVSYDAEVDALYIQFREVRDGSVETREISDGVSVDFGADGKLVGIEVLEAGAMLGDSAHQVIMELVPTIRSEAA